jgi:alpha-ketoglutarate-dependent taurine dioxygenase
VSSVADLTSFVSAFSDGTPLFNYAGGASPRKMLGEGSYTSTEYPPHLQLSLHNELSYADVYPARLYFLCLVAPEEGGETTLGDSRRILRRIDPAVLERFRENEVRYVRNLSGLKGSGYSWQEALETNDPREAEACCRRIGADFEWRADGGLAMSQVRPATAVHPVTGEEVWFNQADGFHPSGLDARTYAELIALCGSEEAFRLNVTYGDGSPIERAALDHVREVIRAETIRHRWRAGDIVVIDNLLAAHGRMPFSGPRKIALAMT